MSLPQDKDARQYYRVAYQRLEDGELLLRNRRAQASIYLTGYAVECILKSLLIVSTPAGQRVDVLRSFRGPSGHDLLGLRDRSVGARIQFDRHVAKDLVHLSSWSTELRYLPDTGDEAEAKAFWQAADRLVKWANERIN